MMIEMAIPFYDQNNEEGSKYHVTISSFVASKLEQRCRGLDFECLNSSL